MTEPLALLLYEKLMPGTQLVNRLQDLKYRVQTLNDPATLVECAEQSKPMLVVVDLESTHNNVCPAIARLKQNPATSHLPVIGILKEEGGAPQTAAQAAGVTLIVTEAAILNHLPLLLERALQMD
jgi:PleD family two-component response regulator